MRRSYFALILLLVCSVITSCSKNEIDNNNSYERSLKSWLSFKEKSNNSYQYTVSQYSWPDHRSITVIKVTNGIVTQRNYKNVSTKGLENIPKEALEWTENENELNTHQTAYAAQPVTLDQIYETARTVWLLKRKGSQSIFEAKNEGMISTCGFSADGCQDDCFNGINIVSIKAL